MTDERYPNLRVLIVDDHMMMRNLIAQNLRAVGIEYIETAANGEDALEKIKQGWATGLPYHIVFLDWHMPGMQGIEVLQTCRSDKKFQKHAIVMLTAEQEEKNIIKAIESGATSYLVKPVAQDTLVKKLTTIVQWLEKNNVDLRSAPGAAPKPTDKITELPVDKNYKLLDTLSEDLRPVVTKGMKNIFSELFQLEIVPDSYIKKEDQQKMVCIGRLHQQGLTIALRFFFDHDLLKPILRQLYSPQYLENHDVYEDAACEIVNIICAQIKAFLNQHDYNVTLELPEIGPQDSKCSSADSIMNIYFSVNQDQYFLVDVAAT